MQEFLNKRSVLYVIQVRSRILAVVVLSYQLYLAVSETAVDTALKNIEHVSSWPVQTLNIGLFVLVLAICWFYLKSTRADLMKLQKLYDDKRKEYIASLKQLATDMAKVIERNNAIFERVDRKLDRPEHKARSQA